MTTEVRRIDHIAIAVRDLRAGVALFQGIFGGTFINGGDDPTIDIRTIQFGLPQGIKIELMTPTSPESYLQAFLDKHGEGFHHMTIIVDDVEETIEDITAAGYGLVGTDLEHPAWRETFLRPSQGLGLLQIVDTVGDWTTPTTQHTVQDVLDGRIVWHDHQTVKKPS